MGIRLRVRTSPSDSYDWQHQGPRFRIGRADDCQLVFHGESALLVSGRHAEIELSTAGTLVSDLGSTNGTFVNGMRLDGSARLEAGDVIQLGQAGPRLQVIAIELPCVPTAPRNDPRANPAPAAPIQPVSEAVQPSAARSGTQMLMVQLQRQNQRSMLLLAVVGLAGLLLVAGIFWSLLPKTPRAPEIAVAPPANASSSGQPVAHADNPSEPALPIAPPVRGDPVVGNPPDRPIEEIVRPFEPAVVWIGYEFDERQYVSFSGFAIKRNVAVTTADAVRYLRAMSEKLGADEVRYVARDSRGAVRIRDFKVHPNFESARDGEAAEHNVALALLDGDLPAPAALAPDAEMQQINVKSALLVLGFENGAPVSEPFDITMDKVRMVRRRAKVTGSEPPGAQWPLSYRLEVTGIGSLTGAQENLVGSPVFDQHGHVVGVLAAMAKNVQMVSAHNFREWVAREVP
jgi:hypothetical protein